MSPVPTNPSRPTPELGHLHMVAWRPSPIPFTFLCPIMAAPSNCPSPSSGRSRIDSLDADHHPITGRHRPEGFLTHSLAPVQPLSIGNPCCQALRCVIAGSIHWHPYFQLAEGVGVAHNDDTIAPYHADAARFAAQYESLAPTDVHTAYLDLLPRPVTVRPWTLVPVPVGTRAGWLP